MEVVPFFNIASAYSSKKQKEKIKDLFKVNSEKLANFKLYTPNSD